MSTFNREKLKCILKRNEIKFFNPYEVDTGEDKAMMTNFDYEIPCKYVIDGDKENKYRFCFGMYKEPNEFGCSLSDVLKIRTSIEESISNHFINMLEIAEKVAVKNAKALLTNVLMDNEEDIIYCFISNESTDNNIYLVHFYLDGTYKVESKYINEFVDENLYD